MAPEERRADIEDWAPEERRADIEDWAPEERRADREDWAPEERRADRENCRERYMTYKVCVPLDYRGPSHCVVSSNERFPHMQTWKHTYNTHMQTCWAILT